MNYILYSIEVGTTIYNFLKKGFYDTLDLSGHTTVNGSPFVYYTYNSQRYLVPIVQTRGPSTSNAFLTEYYKNDPATLQSLMGPHGDWHGRLDEILRIHGYVPVSNASFPSMTLSE